jgi:hypothetical protein
LIEGNGVLANDDSLLSERRVRLLISALDCAEAMIELSPFAQNLETMRRIYENAERLYADATTLLHEVKISRAQEHEIRSRLGDLRICVDTLAR